MKENMPNPCALALMLGSEKFAFKVLRPSRDTNSTNELRGSKFGSNRRNIFNFYNKTVVIKIVTEKDTFSSIYTFYKW